MKKVLGYFPYSGYSVLLQDETGALHWPESMRKLSRADGKAVVLQNPLDVIIELSEKLSYLEERMNGGDE